MKAPEIVCLPLSWKAVDAAVVGNNDRHRQTARFQEGIEEGKPVLVLESTVDGARSSSFAAAVAGWLTRCLVWNGW